MLACKAEPGAFEFVVADRGIGILRSLRRCDSYAALPDKGKAQEAALTDGISRLSIPFIPSRLPTTAWLSGTDIILSQWIL